ncbi:MAG TPA: hypothetical protein VFT66_09170 [Roseiflexaceae bacterium]|nr:hypothetical protein [Roseiflexaceae bacterium]
MAKSQTQTVRGHITVVQEERFRMITEGGQGLLFTLGNSIRYGADDLRRFRDTQTPVVVEYSGAPNLSTGMAHKVQAA